MKRKSWTRCTRDVLLSAPLPEATDTYTVISHSFCINTIKKLLSVKGFKVVNEIYSATDGAEIATGIFHINHGSDPDLGMLFAFANSYNKKVKFSCSVGAYVKVNETSILTEGGSAWIRKHTGNADELAEEVIKQQVEDAVGYFDQLLKDKEAMKMIRLNQTQYAELLGRLYLDVQLLAIGQVSHVRSEYHKPSFSYDGDPNSLWTLYNHILVALAKSHPKTWMDQQKLVHLHLSTVFDLTQFDEVVDDTILESKDGPAIADTDIEVFEGDTELAPELPDEVVEAIEDAQIQDEKDHKNDLYGDEYEEELTPVDEDIPLETEVFTEEVHAGPAAPAEDDEEMEILTDEDIEEAEPLPEGFDNTTIDDHEDLVDQEEIPFVTDEEEDVVMESLLKPVDIEAVREIEETEGVPAKTQSMTVEVALEKFGHLLTEEERTGLQDGNLNQGTIDKLKELAIQYDVVNEQIDKTITEELVKKGTDANSYLPQDPSKIQDKIEEVTESAEVVEDEDDGDDFFMTKQDLKEMGIEDVAVNMIVTIGDDECVVVNVIDDEIVGLSPVALEEVPDEEVVTEEELSEQLHGVNNNEEAITMTAEPIGEDFPEAAPTQMDMNFEIGDADEVIPSDEMLSTTSKSVESVTDVNEEEQRKIDEALAIMEAKVELTPAEQAIHDAIKSEIYELYGEEYSFTYELIGGQYNITLETDEVFVLEKTYVESLNEEV